MGITVNEVSVFPRSQYEEVLQDYFKQRLLNGLVFQRLGIMNRMIMKMSVMSSGLFPQTAVACQCLSLFPDIAVAKRGHVVLFFLCRGSPSSNHC